MNLLRYVLLILFVVLGHQIPFPLPPDKQSTPLMMQSGSPQSTIVGPPPSNPQSLTPFLPVPATTGGPKPVDKMKLPSLEAQPASSISIQQKNKLNGHGVDPAAETPSINHKVQGPAPQKDEKELIETGDEEVYLGFQNRIMGHCTEIKNIRIRMQKLENKFQKYKDIENSRKGGKYLKKIAGLKPLLFHHGGRLRNMAKYEVNNNQRLSWLRRFKLKNIATHCFEKDITIILSDIDHIVNKNGLKMRWKIKPIEGESEEREYSPTDGNPV